VTQRKAIAAMQLAAQKNFILKKHMLYEMSHDNTYYTRNEYLWRIWPIKKQNIST
jgi:hypothetical protein